MGLELVGIGLLTIIGGIGVTVRGGTSVWVSGWKTTGILFVCLIGAAAVGVGGSILSCFWK